MSKKYLLVAGLLCLLTDAASPREVVMSVDRMLQCIALDNKDVKASKSAYAAEREGISVARSAKLPKLTASLELNYIGDGTILDRNFSNSLRDKLPHFGNTLNVTLYQSVYQGGAISAGIDLARRQTELAAIGVAQQTDISAIEALSAYFNLMKMHNLRQVYIDNIALTEKLIEQMRERHKQGTALKNDVTRYELRLSSLNYDLQSVNNSISVYSTMLTSLLNLPDDVTITPAEMPALPSGESEHYWQEATRQESTELKVIDKSRQIAETGLRLDRASRLPSVGIVIGDNFMGPITFEIPAIDKNYNSWFAGISVKYDFSSMWTANKKMRQRKMEIARLGDRRAAIEDALKRKVHESYVAMRQSRQMLDTEKLNVRLANENYEVVDTRFRNDMALLTDMLDASTAKLDAEVRLVNARINFILAYYQLKFISGTLYKS